MLCVPKVNSTEVHEKPVLIVKQESSPLGCVPPACQLHVWWLPGDASWGVVPTPSTSHASKGPGTRDTHPPPWINKHL